MLPDDQTSEPRDAARSPSATQPRDATLSPGAARPRGTRVPPVDPSEPRRIRKALLEPLALSSVGRWYVINVAPKLDRLFYRLTGGRLTSVPGTPIAFLTHRGARTGRERVTPLLYFTDGEDAVLMASNYGRESHPAWFHNLRANPEVTLRVGGRGGRYRARVATAEDRDRLWTLAKQLTRAYADYEQRAERSIQVVRCSPLDRPA